MATARKDPAEVNALLDAEMQRINNKYKHRVIARAGSVPNPFFLRRPSGIMQLDIDTGGGLPAGGWCLVSGPEGAGKTTLLNQYFKYQQQLYGEDCRNALATVEFPPDHMRLRDSGVLVEVPDDMIVEQNQWRKSRGLSTYTKDQVRELKRQVGRFDIITGATGEEILEAVLALYATKKYHIIGVDSISVVLPSADADKNLDDNEKRAAPANLLTQFSKHFHPLTLGLDDETNETTLVMVSQVRANNAKSEANPGVQKYLKDWASTGAYAMRHGKLIDITIWGGKKKSQGEKEERVATGKMLNWEITKGKCGTHDGIRGEVEYDYVKKIDDIQTVFVAGLEDGIILPKGKEFEVVRAAEGGAEATRLSEALTRKELFVRLEQDFAFQHQVRIEILAARGIRCRYR